MPTGDYLGIGANGGPGVNIAVAENALKLGRHVLLLGMAEGPDFVALDAFAWQITHRPILKLCASVARIHKDA